MECVPCVVFIVRVTANLPRSFQKTQRNSSYDLSAKALVPDLAVLVDLGLSDSQFPTRNQYP